MFYLLLVFGIVFISFFTLIILFQFVDSKWFCKNMGWHKPTEITFDGITLESKCRICQEKILQDGNGDWFEM